MTSFDSLDITVALKINGGKELELLAKAIQMAAVGKEVEDVRSELHTLTQKRDDLKKKLEDTG